MIARPKISQNEWKTAEIGAFEVGNFALLCCPGVDVARRGVRALDERQRARALVALRQDLDVVLADEGVAARADEERRRVARRRVRERAQRAQGLEARALLDGRVERREEQVQHEGRQREAAEDRAALARDVRRLNVDAKCASRLQCARMGPDSFAVLRELDESYRFVKKSAESTSM